MSTYMNKTLLSLLALTVIFSFHACEDLVEDGYRIDYEKSDAQFTVQAISLEQGAVGDAVSYELTVNAEYDIKSCIVTANYVGANGSGFDVATEGYDDPFADHNYGTIQSGTRSFTVKYDYIIPENAGNIKITFSIVDESGQVSEVVNVGVVAKIKRYENRSLYAKSYIFNDAFATIDGLVYPDIKTNYSSTTEESVTVQEKIDIIFYYDESENVSVISAPNDWRVSVDLQVENATLFKKLDVTTEEFDDLTAASLVALTASDSIAYYGESQVRGVEVGDVIGFFTDINAIHDQKSGMIKVKSLHPVNVGHYDGTAYVMDCDIVTQID